MKLDRRKNAIRNVFFGIVLRFYNMLMPFIMRSVMIYTLGIDYLGLNGLFVSVLQILNLAELGVGSAMIFSMYKPIAEQNTSKICALINLYRYYYRIIGGVILFLGLLLLPFIPYMISGDVPTDINIYVVYLLNLSGTVFSYWFLAYRNSILRAHQREDVVSKITMLTVTIQYGIQFLVLYFLHNYYYYVIAILFTQILNNVLTAIASRHMYPNMYPYGEVSSHEKSLINQRIKDLFTAKLGGTILNSADTLVISTFLGLKILAMYQNYYLIMNAVMSLFTVFFSSILAGVGNSLITEDREKNFRDFERVTFIVFVLMAVCMSEMLILYQPFMELWVGQDLMLDMNVVILLCVYFFVVEYVMLVSLYKDAGGIWHADRLRPLISGLINLGVNLFVVNYWGLYGVIMSTIISSGFVSAPWVTYNIFKLMFIGKEKIYLKGLLENFVVIILSMISSYFVSSIIYTNGIIGILIRFLLVLVVSLVVISVYHMKKIKELGLKQLYFNMLRRT